MSATAIFVSSPWLGRRQLPFGGSLGRRFWRHRQLWSVGLILVSGLPFGGWADPTPATSVEAARVNRAYAEARHNYLAALTNTSLAWQFGRACFDRAEFATNNAERALLAEQGIAACRTAIQTETNAAAAHYYLGMNLGQLARVKRFTALWLLDDLELAFRTACALDERFDYAGPDRNLGLLYRDAPGWPLSVGSRAKARKHLERAAALAPEFPENRLNLLESCLRWGDGAEAQREFKALGALWPIARTNLVGETWTAAWADWEKRLAQARDGIEKRREALVAPHEKK